MEKTKSTSYPDGNWSVLFLWFWNMSWEACVMTTMMANPNWTKVFGGCGLERSGWFERVVVGGIPYGNYGRMWMNKSWIWRTSRELHKELKTEATHNLRHRNVAGGGGSVLAYVGSKFFYHFFKSCYVFDKNIFNIYLLF